MDFSERFSNQNEIDKECFKKYSSHKNQETHERTRTHLCHTPLPRTRTHEQTRTRTPKDTQAHAHTSLPHTRTHAHTRTRTPKDARAHAHTP